MIPQGMEWDQTYPFNTSPIQERIVILFDI
jgi:hypothetical protein